MKLSEKIRKHRKEIGLTQVDLGQIMGLPQNSISRWENGGRTPSFKNREKLSIIFNKPLEYFKNDE